MNQLNEFPPPTDYQRIFESDVWNIFNMLGLKYKCFLYPTKPNLLRLLPPPNTTYANWDTNNTDAIDFLTEIHLAEKFEPVNFEHHGNAVKSQFRLTELGERLFDELSKGQDSQKRFVERIKPDRFFKNNKS